MNFDYDDALPQVFGGGGSTFIFRLLFLLKHYSHTGNIPLQLVLKAF